MKGLTAVKSTSSVTPKRSCMIDFIGKRWPADSCKVARPQLRMDGAAGWAVIKRLFGVRQPWLRIGAGASWPNTSADAELFPGISLPPSAGPNHL